jgi:hypothetical protein
MKRWIILGMLAAALALTATVASAGHSWGGYHWAWTANPFTLKLENDLTGVWPTYLSVASGDWWASSVLDTTIIDQRAPTGNCKAILGKDAVCNKAYGFNGWLGIAQIWLYSDGHIAQGVVKLNDSYFNTATYNTTGWRSLVMCQEVGHTFGLGHQDENFSNAPIVPHTCMDYFVPDASEVVHPNEHDYVQLETIYEHLDSKTTLTQAARMPAPRSGGHDDDDFGAPTGKKDGQGLYNEFERKLGNGQTLITHVFWVERGNPDKGKP